MIKVKIISNKTKWNCVPPERIKYHFCDVPIGDVQPQLNCEETSDKSKLMDILISETAVL